MPKVPRHMYKSKRRLPLSKAQSRAVAKIANKQINRLSELKYKDLTISNTKYPYDTTAPQLVSMPAQGDTQTTRDGDSIYIKSLFLRGQSIGSDAANASPGRLIVFQWLEDSAVATPTAADILEDTTQFLMVHSPYKIDEKKKFKILYDKRFTAGQDPSDTQVKFHQANLAKNLRIRKIQFNAGAVTGVGQIYVLPLSWENNASGNAQNWSYYVRMRYLDN